MTSRALPLYVHRNFRDKGSANPLQVQAGIITCLSISAHRQGGSSHIGDDLGGGAAGPVAVIIGGRLTRRGNCRSGAWLRSRPGGAREGARVEGG